MNLSACRARTSAYIQSSGEPFEHPPEQEINFMGTTIDTLSTILRPRIYLCFRECVNYGTRGTSRLSLILLIIVNTLNFIYLVLVAIDYTTLYHNIVSIFLIYRCLSYFSTLLIFYKSCNKYIQKYKLGNQNCA